MSEGAEKTASATPPGWFVRAAWLGPAALALVFIALLGGLLRLMQLRALQTERAELIRGAGTARESVQQRLEASRNYLAMLSEDMARGALTEGLFHKRLSQYMADYPELVNVVYVDRSGTGRWRAPRDPEDRTVGMPLACPQSRAGFETARRTSRAAFSQPHVSLQGEPAFDVNVPILRDGDFEGTFVGVYSCRRVLRHTLQREILQSHHISLADADGNVVVALPAAAAVDERLIRIVSLDPPGHGLSLRLERYGSGFWGVGLTLLAVLCVGLVVGMAWGMWSLNRQVGRRARAERALREARDALAQRVRERTADLQETNVQLQQEIAERAKAEGRSRRHQAELAHVSRVSTMGELAAGLAHELNQPLGAIASFAEGGLRILEGSPDDAEQLRVALEEIAEQGRRAGRIIHRLQAFLAKSELQRRPCDPRRITAEVVDLLKMDIRQNEIEFSLDVPDDLAPVLADRIQIQQVILNLMRNAIEAMGGAAGPRRLSVSAAARGGDAVEFAVRDSGPGCSPEALDRMFDAFFTTKESGIGMGLSISRSIIEAHDGHLWVEPGDGRGLTFRFTLPIAGGEDDEPNHET